MPLSCQSNSTRTLLQIQKIQYDLPSQSICIKQPIIKDTCLYHCLSIDKVISALNNLMGLVYSITAHQRPCQYGTYKSGEDVSDGFEVCHSYAFVMIEGWDISCMVFVRLLTRVR